MLMMLILLLLTVVLVMAFIAVCRHNRISEGESPSAKAEEVSPTPIVDSICCGQHAVCDKESLLAGTSKQIEYYDDEELDRFAGRPSDGYTEAETEEFRNILYTMLESDVAGWVRSLQLRGIALPEALRDEIILIVNERRENNQHG